MIDDARLVIFLLVRDFSSNIDFSLSKREYDRYQVAKIHFPISALRRARDI